MTGCKMERSLILFCVIPALAIAITVSSNGNSPHIKMLGGMMVDVEKEFAPVRAKLDDENTVQEYYNKSDRKLNLNATKLSLNERYRRLIPYMTFYYANDLTTPTTEAYSTKDVEVEKVHLVEASLPERTAKLIQPSYHNVPRYQGNRLTKHNIASANPGRIYKDPNPAHRVQFREPVNYSPVSFDHKYFANNDIGRQNVKPTTIRPDIIYSSQNRRPYLDFYHTDDNSEIKYYVPNKEPAQKFKLVPYDQTPPVKFIAENGNYYENKQVSLRPVLVTKSPVYVKPRPFRPHSTYDNVYYHHPSARKQPVTISENYYENLRASGQDLKVPPVIEGGFKPILTEQLTQTTEAPVYMSTVQTEAPHAYYEYDKQQYETSSVSPVQTNAVLSPNYYQYVVEQPLRPTGYVSNSLTLSDLLQSLQKSKSIPRPITRDNVGSSIKTLLQALNTLRVAPLHNEVIEAPVLSTPKPFVSAPKIVEIPSKSVEEPVSELNGDVEFSQEPYLAPVSPPSQHLDDFSAGGGSTQSFPLRINSDDEGGTPGKPGVDYPILTIIPETSFDCKTQRYKGFFADPETKCQVWHYCDLNGGQASFLCPNGTIFSQAALTCDWWFNVRCASTTQLYVLNESLYKYILPHSPKFPEDYSGPLVDKYLTLKFKEMEEQFRKNKNKQSASDKMDSDEEDDFEEKNSTEENDVAASESNEKSSVSESSIVVETSGTSGNVERLQI